MHSSKRAVLGAEAQESHINWWRNNRGLRSDHASSWSFLFCAQRGSQHQSMSQRWVWCCTAAPHSSSSTCYEESRGENSKHRCQTNLMFHPRGMVFLQTNLGQHITQTTLHISTGFCPIRLYTGNALWETLIVFHNAWQKNCLYRKTMFLVLFPVCLIHIRGKNPYQLHLQLASSTELVIVLWKLTSP